MNAKEITIIGATGQIGIPVTLYLAQSGFNVLVIARNIEKAERYFGRGNNITIVYGDLTDKSSLISALKGTRYLYLNLSTMTTDANVPFAAERDGISNILSAVDRYTIRQIIAISGLGAFQKDIVPERYTFAPNVIRSQGHQLLKESGIPYTILHCTWFADAFLIYQRKGTYAVIGNNNNPIYFINAYDYAQQLANTIGNKTAYNKEYPIQGKEGMVHMEAAKKFLQIYAPEVKVKVLPMGIINLMAFLNKEMKVLKVMAKYFKNSKEVFQAIECGTYNDLGEPQLSLQQYANKIKIGGIYNYDKFEIQ